MDFLFLPPIYIAALVVSAVVAGIIFEVLSRDNVLIAAGALFGIFSTSQLIFRILQHEMPERLIGQILYFFVFLVIVALTRRIKDRLIG